MDDARIAQFRKMTEADPANELGHFSLGQALLEAKQYKEAATCFERVIELNDQNSKAYHLLALAQNAAGERSKALGTARLGFDIAHSRGDIRPRDGLAALMRMFGEEPPEVDDPVRAKPGPAIKTGEGQITCRRCGAAKAPMAERPFKGELGERVLASICPDCWREWLFMGTKVINELRLDFANPQHGRVYDQHLREFLRLD
ncbi:MAG TPA: Fe(2+)-trafficking protein [Phycisphaerae bacterium]|nr:Fe(2+)-trafficking protein [Phycisphaerae bacterium]HRY66456.1 Fe(2+)-trafficking protein [Phycisphaerae bacterium]HSA25836.1 Fe(2+)-trafficking protein [Phycisphaerae bacterium]